MTAVVAASGIVTATPESAPIFVGIGFVAMGGLLLWYRHDLYLVSQWLVRYPDQGFVYVALQFVPPLLLIAAGIALILYPVTGV
jgi:hypothetical protein